MNFLRNSKNITFLIPAKSPCLKHARADYAGINFSGLLRPALSQAPRSPRNDNKGRKQ